MAQPIGITGCFSLCAIKATPLEALYRGPIGPSGVSPLEYPAAAVFSISRSTPTAPCLVDPLAVFMLYIRKGGEYVDEEREIPEEISFKQAKRALMNILYDTPESTDTEKSGIVAYSCIMDEETQGITGKGGFTGDTWNRIRHKAYLFHWKQS